MLQSFYNSLAGMNTFSKALDNISNNIANINTPGYKGADMFMRNLNGPNNSGYGSRIEGSQPRLYAGEIRQTGNPTDMAIIGEGYFVLRDQDGQLYYTRAGQFRFNEDDKLVEAATEYEVLSLDDAGKLSEINIGENKLLGPLPTSKVSVRGNLSASSETYTVSDLALYDSTGKSHQVNLVFTYAQENKWQVEVKSGETILTEFETAFSEDGSPLQGSNRVSTTLSLDGQSTDVEFFFGDAGSYVGATQIGSVSNLAAQADDGRTAVGLADLQVDDAGVLNFRYTNGDKAKGAALALAHFTNQFELGTSKGNIYQIKEGQEVTYGKAKTGKFGLVQKESLELSNVELTQEFADLLMIQRGYQASARVMNVANEMIEQLYGNRG